MVLSCIDPRFQTIVFNYLKKKKLTGKYSSFTIAGSAIGVTANKFKRWHKTFWDNFDTSIKFHNIKKLIVINHRDCGAAKIINGKKEFSKINETKVHKNSFYKIKKLFKRFKGEIDIIAAGSITYKNIKKIHKTLGLKIYHGKKIVDS